MQIYIIIYIMNPEHTSLEVDRLAGAEPSNALPVEFGYLGARIDPNDPLPEHDGADDVEERDDRREYRDARSDSGSGADAGTRVPSIDISSAGPSASVLWLGPGS